MEISGEHYSTRSLIHYRIRFSDELVQVDPSGSHRCTLVHAVISPVTRLVIPCFCCSDFTSHAAYLKSVEFWLAHYLQWANFPQLPLAGAIKLVRAFTHSVLLPAEASHRCTSPGSTFNSVRLANFDLQFISSIPFVDESIILDSSFEEPRAARSVTIPASKRAVIELVAARVEEEIKEGARFGRGWTGTGHDCVICMEEIRDPRRALKLPCRHAFHESCLVRWFRTQHVCPLCRHPVPTDN